MKKNASKKTAGVGDQWLIWEDAVLNHCHTLDTLAELLVHTGRNDVVKVETVNATGGLMKDEVARLKKRLQSRPQQNATR